jgi:hypothetical protein
LQFDWLSVLGSFAKIVEKFRRGFEDEELLAQIRKATSIVNKCWGKKSNSTAWVGRSYNRFEIQKKNEWKERNKITDRTGTIVSPRTINGLDNFLQSQEPCHDEVFQPSWKGTRERKVDPMHLPHH